MTDSEIIKYLEQAIDEYDKNEIFVDNIRLDKFSLDLINRQKAEIERLKIENQSLRGSANSYKLHYNKARTEAVKEFAERLKNTYFIDSERLCYQVDKVSKEMVGDTE